MKPPYLQVQSMKAFREKKMVLDTRSEIHIASDFNRRKQKSVDSKLKRTGAIIQW